MNEELEGSSFMRGRYCMQLDTKFLKSNNGMEERMEELQKTFGLHLIFLLSKKGKLREVGPRNFPLFQDGNNAML